MNIFKKKVSAKDALRTSKREMADATRGIEREIASLQLEVCLLAQIVGSNPSVDSDVFMFSSSGDSWQEKKLVAEIKKTAKTGNEAATRILARQLIRLRQQITNLQGTRAQIRGVATHTQAMYASTSISAGMKGASKAMAAMNKQMEPAKQAKIMREFQKQSTQMDMTIEMMSETIDETLDKDEAEEETEELTNQVLDEIGVDVASQLSSAPKGRIAVNNKKVENTAARTAAPQTSEVDDLEKRLASLRRI
ncbi:vacuolar protein sorting-associated protein 2 homolog 2-like isoform X1 [Typha angustifolia]|uniref:vacuolar protein sorting-associated protein 2 homolog 2-like isoform X1 n=1 Tax=Typha angustifolia TaxID=59011 RepID=UPI003C2EA5CC